MADAAKSKDQAKSQSRQVGTPKGSRAVTKQSKSSTGVIAWVAVFVVVAIIAVVVIVGVTNKKSTSGNGGFTPAPASVVTPVVSIPMSTYNAIGISGPNVNANPIVVSSAVNGGTTPPLQRLKNPVGQLLPGVFYNGAEFCPYCAAERWGMVAALSRFGTWSHLGLTTSSSIDVSPNTNTFSFRNAQLMSSLIGFQSVENTTNQIDPKNPNAYTPLQSPNAVQRHIIAVYDNPPYASAAGYPFVSFGNQALIVTPTYSPDVLAGLNWQQISNLLKDPNNAVTQDIVASANYISASVCHIDGQQPAAVCSSSGVQAATKAIGFK